MASTWRTPPLAAFGARLAGATEPSQLAGAAEQRLPAWERAVAAASHSYLVTLENHRKTIGKWWLNGNLWDLPSGYVKKALENCNL